MVRVGPKEAISKVESRKNRNIRESFHIVPQRHKEESSVGKTKLSKNHEQLSGGMPNVGHEEG